MSFKDVFLNKWVLLNCEEMEKWEKYEIYLE